MLINNYQSRCFIIIKYIIIKKLKFFQLDVSYDNAHPRNSIGFLEE